MVGICPKCKKKLTYLLCYQEVVKEWLFKPKKNGRAYADMNNDEATETGVFVCPECDEELTRCENMAIEILKGNVGEVIL